MSGVPRLRYGGCKMPTDLYYYLRSGHATAILATFSNQGIPHTTPLNMLYPLRGESVLMGIYKEHAGYYNMIWQKKITLCVMGDGNIAYSLSGRGGVVVAPSYSHPLINVCRLDITEIKKDTSSLVTINQGIKWSHTSDDAEDLYKFMYEELKELSFSL